MIYQTTNIIAPVERYVTAFLTENLSPNLAFHNVHHTQNVVYAVTEISKNIHLSYEETEPIIIAAWFHDCGYAFTYNNHEDSSKSIACDFLRKQNYPEKNIDTVLSCIEATRFPQNPTTVQQQVLCDADLFHFTKTNYHIYEEALREEFKTIFNKNYTDEEWMQTNCAMLLNHKYFTDYGKNILQKFKEVNIERMKCKFASSNT